MSARARFGCVLAAAFVLRAAIAATPGYPGDREDFIVWARVLAAHGPLGVYAPGVVPTVDYVPGYLYVLWVAGIVHAAIGGGAVCWRVLLEIVPIASDLALIAVLYAVAKRARASDSQALTLAAVLALAPPLWLDSAVWGQADALPIVLAVLALASALGERMIPAWLALAASVFVKPLTIVVGPTLAVLQFRTRGVTRSLAGAAALAFATVYCATLPFTTARAPGAVFSFLVSRYVRGAQKAPFVTEGGFTLYPLLANFFTPDAARLGPLSYYTWSLLLVGAAVAAATITLARSLGTDDDAKRIARVFGAASLALLGLFLFATRMHERYLLPAIVVGSPLALEDRPTALALGCLAFTFTIDCVYSLANFTGGAHHPITVVFARLLCALNLAAFAVLWQRQLRRLAA